VSSWSDHGDDVLTEQWLLTRCVVLLPVRGALTDLSPSGHCPSEYMSHTPLISPHPLCAPYSARLSV
jgi:hypothetical protein